MNEKKEFAGKHSISIENRQKFSANGIVEVITFEEKNIVIDTKQGRLIIKGNNLHIDKLNLETSDIELAGQINSLNYDSSSEKRKKGLIQSLFK
ncbi:MAG: sporulation protein YabP [Clostridiales bacterium GWD2_32_59]|nr:MAG: sporulation protein YabP [Clostridiales bacterium GWD2_32_59]